MSSWLLGITHHCILAQHRRQVARREQRGLSAVEDLPDQDDLERVWQTECDRAVLVQALHALREHSRLDDQTIRAFELLSVYRLAPAEVAEQLELSTAEVYVAKHRCLKRLRPIVQQLDEAYEIGS